MIKHPEKYNAAQLVVSYQSPHTNLLVKHFARCG